MRQDELMHYGVPGMKWGHRKASSSSSGGRSKGAKLKNTYSKVTRKVGKAYTKQKADRYEKAKQSVRDRGYIGAQVNNYTKYTTKRAAKKLAVHVINGSANAFISGSNANYKIKRGVDVTRNLAIKGLSFSALVDKSNYYHDSINIGKAYMSGVRKKK